MRAKSFMIIAGEASGDLLAAELVQALRAECNRTPIPLTWDYQPLKSSLAPRFFGAGGSHMAEAGVELQLDLTAHSLTGIPTPAKVLKFQRILNSLYRAALQREPDVVICVDFAGFNRRLAHKIRKFAHRRSDWFHDWKPRIIQYVSPQVWASRENRAYQMARDYDMVLSIVPFEREWYAQKVPQLKVEFVGHSMVDRYKPISSLAPEQSPITNGFPKIVLLPGSRPGEVKRHVPVLVGALNQIRAAFPQTQATMVVPNEGLLAQVKGFGLPEHLKLQAGNIAEALRPADLALSKTGTITLECAYFGVPTIALYKTSFVTWQIAKRIVLVKYGAMPNLLANEELYPEFIQDAATPQNLARAALELLRDDHRRHEIKRRLQQVVTQLGPPGAATRAARAILSLLSSGH